MATWTTPATFINGQLVAASDLNTQLRDNSTVLRAGGVAITSQAAGDIITASSATQFSRAAMVDFGFQAVAGGRLTLTTGTPVTSSDVTAATTLYYSPYTSAQIAVYDGSSAWSVLTFSELSIAVPATTSQMYDVFVYSSSGTATLELLAWTNDSTRATALVRQNGVYVKSGATTRRYVGSFRTTTVSGQTEDSTTKRYVWNYYNRVPRLLQRFETTSSWTYSSTTIRQANAATANKVETVVGVVESPIALHVSASGEAAAGVSFKIGIGLDSTTTFSTGNSPTSWSVASSLPTGLTVNYHAMQQLGYHYYSWNEAGDTSTTTVGGTWSQASTYGTAGISGSILG